MSLFRQFFYLIYMLTRQNPLIPLKIRLARLDKNSYIWVKLPAKLPR